MSNRFKAHMPRYEGGMRKIELIGGQEDRSMILMVDNTDNEPVYRPPTIPGLQPVRKYIKLQKAEENDSVRVSQKWMTREAQEAFELAQQYVQDQVVGQPPTAIEDYAQNRDPSFYTCLGIGIRTFMAADPRATGVE